MNTYYLNNEIETINYFISMTYFIINKIIEMNTLIEVINP